MNAASLSPTGVSALHFVLQVLPSVGKFLRFGTRRYVGEFLRFAVLLSVQPGASQSRNPRALPARQLDRM